MHHHGDKSTEQRVRNAGQHEQRATNVPAAACFGELDSAAWQLHQSTQMLFHKESRPPVSRKWGAADDNVRMISDNRPCFLCWSACWLCVSFYGCIIKGRVVLLKLFVALNADPQCSSALTRTTIRGTESAAGCAAGATTGNAAGYPAADVQYQRPCQPRSPRGCPVLPLTPRHQ